MSYISIIVPAFYIQNETDFDSISNFCSEQFELTSDSFELIKLSLPNNFGIMFKESNLSLSSIEDLIYQRDCIKSTCEKTFESLETMTIKLNQLENEITFITESETTTNDDNNKISNLPIYQLKSIDNMKNNTEKSLNTIKEEFKLIVQELETLRAHAPLTRPISTRESSHSSLNSKRFGNKINTNNLLLGNNSKVNNVNDINKVIPKLNLDKKI